MLTDGGNDFEGVVDAGALQDAVVPPLEPAQVHVHGPVPEGVDGVPGLQRFAEGAEVVGTPFAGPQEPFVMVGGTTHATFTFLVALVPPGPVQNME